MIIKRLTMNNFGVYAGCNTFEFVHSQPIVLIGGMNGRGKTTFLEAILLALYGSNSNAFKESRYRSYGKYLRSYINNSTPDAQTSVELEFVMNESSQNMYRVCRKWDAKDKKTEENITVEENGVYSQFLTNNWAMFIENILPSALSSFYFFDGEKIAELAVDDTNVQMKESIRSMLGISVLDVLKNDLNKVLKKTIKESPASESGDEIQDLREEKEQLANQVEALSNKLDEIEAQILTTQNEISELHHQYEIKGGDAIEQRQAMIQKRSELLAEIEKNRNELTDISASELPLILVNNLIARIKLQAEDEHDDFIMQQALGQIDLLLSSYAMENPNSAEINKNFVDYVKESVKSDTVESIYHLSDHALFQLNSLLDNVFVRVKTDVERLLQKKKDLNKKLDEVESYLNLDISEKGVKKLFSTIRKKESMLVQLQVRKKEIERKFASANMELSSKSAALSKAVETYLTNAELIDDADRMKKYAGLALRIIDSYSVSLQKRKTDVLGNTITSCYKKLANKKNLIQRILMDPNTLDISYVDEQGDVVLKDSLSAGEKQLMVIAILWALAICSRKKLPVIIDTPLSRLDSMHRTSLVTEYFPNASDQTIILSTDSEIDHNYYDMMKNYVGDEFTLSYNEETKSTRILKGYFQEP